MYHQNCILTTLPRVFSRKTRTQHVRLNCLCFRYYGVTTKEIHIFRMDDNRPVKVLLHSKLFHGSRPGSRPYLRFKDTCKSTLKCDDVLDLWKTIVENRQEWRRLICTVCESHDIKRVKEDESRREGRRQKKSRP